MESSRDPILNFLRRFQAVPSHEPGVEQEDISEESNGGYAQNNSTAPADAPRVVNGRARNDAFPIKVRADTVLWMVEEVSKKGSEYRIASKEITRFS